MKEKFREFFEKHRHLIVISLILAVVLVALTMVLLRAEIQKGDPRHWQSLSSENYKQVRFALPDWPALTEEQRFFCRNPEYVLSGTELQQLCRALDDGVKRGRRGNPEGEEMAALIFSDADRWKHLSFCRLRDGYALVYRQQTGRAYWILSDEAAELVLRYVQNPPELTIPENYKVLLFDPEQYQTVVLTMCGQEEMTYTLDQTQFPLLAQLMEEGLAEAKPHHNPFWTLGRLRDCSYVIDLTFTGGYVLQVQWSPWSYDTLAICGVSGSQWECFAIPEGNVLADLPALLEE